MLFGVIDLHLIHIIRDSFLKKIRNSDLAASLMFFVLHPFFSLSKSEHYTVGMFLQRSRRNF